MVKIKYLTDTDDAKKNDVENVDKKAANAFVKAGIAEFYIKEEPQKEYGVAGQQPTYAEPVLNNQETKWLTVIYQSFPPDGGTPEQMRDVDNFEKKPVFHVHKPNRWVCLRCMNITESETTPLECPKDTGCGRTNTKFRRIHPPIDKDLWPLPIWKDIKTDDLDMQNTYLELLNLIKQCIVFSEEMDYKIYTLWIISTWKQEQWDTIGFLIFRGLISSGKTRALDIIKQIAYRPIQATGISMPALFRFTDIYNTTILVDEIDNKIDKRTEGGRIWLDYLKPSYRRGSCYYTADKEDQDKIKKYRNFGFKAFAGEKGGFDRAMFDRSITFHMDQNVPEALELKQLQPEFERIRTMLLNYRFKFMDPPELPDTIDIPPRTREIYSSILRTALHIGIDIDDILKIITEREKEKLEELQNSDEYFVLSAVANISQTTTNTLTGVEDAPETVSYRDIAEYLNWEDEKRQKIGYVFRRLGLKTKRQKDGYVVSVVDEKNRNHLSQLYKRFHL